MKYEKELHLDQNQVLMAVVDETLLPEPLQQHLFLCPHCREQKKDAEEAFHQLGEKARKLAPKPKTRPHLPAAASPKRFWRPLPALAFSVLLLLSAAYWGIFSKPSGPMLSQNQSSAEVWEDEALMTEIEMLSENVLTDGYLKLTAAVDSGFNEDFFEYIVPSTDNRPMTKSQGIKGGSLC